MVIPRPLRKWIAIFRGDLAATLILLSVLLGFWFGLTPGWYGLHVLLLIIALVVNVHFGLFLLSAALGKALSLAAAPALYHTGIFVQDTLGGMLAAAAQVPVLAITDFSRYAVAGALLLGPLVGLVLGAVLAIAVQTFRRTWLRLQEESDAFQRWRSKGWVRLLDRLLIGKGVADVRGVLQRKTRWVRWPGVILALVVVVASAAVVLLVDDAALAEHTARSLSAVNGAEVNVEAIELDLLAGQASVAGVQVTDPVKPAQNRVAIDRLDAQVSYWDLLFGRIVMKDVSVAGVTFDSPRAAPGKVLTPPEPAEPEPFAPRRYNLPDMDVAQLESYLADADAMQDQLASVSEWLPDDSAAAPPSELAEPTVPEHYLGYLAAQADVPPAPRIIVRTLNIDDVNVPLPQLGNSRVTCRNLSDAPIHAALPVTIEVSSKVHQTLLKAECRYDRASGGAEIAGSFKKVALTELQKALSSSNPMVFTGGTASAVVTGRADRAGMDLFIQVQTEDLQANATGAVAGLDAQIAGEAFKVLEDLETTLRLVGPWREPRLAFDTEALAHAFRDALVDAGKTELARQADAMIARELGGSVPGASEMLEKPDEAVKGIVGGLLDRQKDDKSEDERRDESGDDAKKQKRGKDIKDALGGLLGGQKKGVQKKGDDKAGGKEPDK